MTRTSHSMQTREQIDRRCDEFEAAWQQDPPPRIEDYLHGIEGRSRNDLLQELIAIELHYRQAEGEAVSDEQLIAEHPDLHNELAEAVKRLRIAEQLAARRDAEQQKADSAADVTAPAGTDADWPSSRGLHIRCPHCSSPVELVADTPFDSVTCRTCGSGFQFVDKEDTSQANVLKRLGRFELLSRLGMGGFGTVWRARDTELDREVAVKIPRKGQLNLAETEQFFREARAAAQLQHPNIVPVHEVGREDETIFIVSDFVRGAPLSEWCEFASPRFKQMAEVTAKIAAALQHAHDEGVIHRDVKPANILVDGSGEPHIMDFGLAKRELGEMTMTLDGQILGTPSYMSPEQAQGDSHWTDRRTDIYSLGVVLFEMLTNELPYHGNAQSQIQQRIREDAPDPRRFNRFIPRDLATICLKCLERDPNRRYGHAADLAAELGRFIRGEPIRARPVTRFERGLRWTRRNPAPAAVIALVVFLAIAGPLAAVRIESQRRELVQTIANFKQDKTGDIREKSDLKSQLAQWEGVDNPFATLTLDSATDARRAMLSDLLNEQGDETAKKLQSAEYIGENALYGHLALAALHEELGHATDAEAHYRAAVRLLEKRSSERSRDPRAMHVLARSYTHLARLLMESEKPAATQFLEQARSTYAQLNTSESDPITQAEHLEVELRHLALVGREAGKASVESISAAREAFKQNIPTEPQEFWELVRLLTRDNALSLNRKAVTAAPTEQ